MRLKFALLFLTVPLVAGCITVPGIPGAPFPRPPRPTWTGPVEADANQCKPFTLVGWDRSALDRRVEDTSFGIATKTVDNHIYLGVISDVWDVKIDVRQIDRLRAEAPYALRDTPSQGVQFWKLNLLSGENELISREQWHAAGERTSFTIAPLGGSFNEASPWLWTLEAGYNPITRTYPPPRERPPGKSVRLIPSRIQTSLLKHTAGYSQIAAFCGTLRQPYSRQDDLCVEFMTKHNDQWRSLGVTQLVGTAGLKDYDAEWSSLIGFVAQGRYWVYLFEDKLWVVPVPANPYLPPTAK
jgi:hypothetical protein